jgi:hypothetical protein
LNPAASLFGALSRPNCIFNQEIEQHHEDALWRSNLCCRSEKHPVLEPKLTPRFCQLDRVVPKFLSCEILSALWCLMQPGDRLARPHAGRIFASKLFGDFAQHRVIVGRAVLRDSPPVHRFRGEMGIPTVSDNVAVPSFRIGVFLLHEGDAAKTILQSSHKVVVGQIAF